MNKSDNDQEVQEEEEKCKQRSRGKKRKRVESDSSTDAEDVLPENTLEVEKNLHASAIRNNLDDVSVKKILKKVVTNDHVLALVKLREEEEDSGTEEKLRPKITRAKAKELMKVSPKSAPWNLELTPIKHIPVKTRPEVKALIAQELPEDEDDEEYEPTHDDVLSDDDHTLESSSDVDSLPRTPATPRSQKNTTPNVVTDGPFKVPQQNLPTPVRRKLVLEEEATIALRTRSKLSLSATSIEHIESSFVPPDDLPMPDVDSLWNDFLKECLNPVSNARNEDDDEADPEYNVAADPDANEEDEESLENSIIKISKKELNDLVTELFSIIPDSGPEQTDSVVADNIVRDMLTEHTTLQTDIPTRWEGKQEPESEEERTTVAPRPAPVAAKQERVSIGKCEPEDHDNENDNENFINEESNSVDQIEKEPKNTNVLPPPVIVIKSSKGKLETNEPPLLRSLATKPLPIRVEIHKDACDILPEQLLLLQQQLRQHIQMATSSYLQLFVHPTHWSRAPIYKEYLVAFEKMVEKIPTSVVNVCNLKPALELVASWEKAVSKDTKENLEMVKFIQKEQERNQRRSAQNAYHVGDFPELFLQVVSNSTVFLYPGLLPGMPFRPEYNTRRATYLKSEDHLIALGLDQFWEYVYSNPEIYRKPTYVHPRHRWGLSATIQLICKHMMPWLVPKTLLGHVRHVKKGLDKDNPIYKFFESRTVEPVKHFLLRFNPQLTLYEQPEHEVPRIWIRYLAKSSSRFKKYLQNRNKTLDAHRPEGVEINVHVQAPNKAPLPIDFNKKIDCTRLNLLPKREVIPLVNRIDVPIDKGNPPNQTNRPLLASEIFTVFNTSTGSFLVPLQVHTKTVDSTITPVCAVQETTAEKPDRIAENAVNNDDDIEGTRTAERSNPTKDSEDSLGFISNGNPEHCSCCILIRNICKKKKKTIVDYFKINNSDASSGCQCKGRRYPKMTNRLKLLLNNYGTHSKRLFDELKYKLTRIKKTEENVMDSSDSLISDDNEHDLVTATLFQLKLTTTTAVVRNNYTKKRLHTLFSNFDVHSDSVLALTAAMNKLCEQELIPYYKEFTGFLTAEQADVVGHFKDYFVHRCMENLIKKIEEIVSDKEKQSAMLSFLKSKFFTTSFQTWSACNICTALLQMMDEYPALAQYVFSMFPHKHAQSEKIHQIEQSEPDSVGVEILTDNPKEPADSNTAVDSESDHCTSIDIRHEEDGNAGTNENLDEVRPFVNEQESSPVKVEDEEIVKDTNVEATMTEMSKDVSDMRTETHNNDNLEMDTSEMSAEGTIVKTECPEWKRDEDKVILEVLKQHITPEGRKDKTILEILEETEALTMISDSLPHKSVSDVQERILYLLQLLVNSDQ